MVSEECNFLFIPTSAAWLCWFPLYPVHPLKNCLLHACFYFCQVRSQLLWMGWGIHEVAAVCVWYRNKRKRGGGNQVYFPAEADVGTRSNYYGRQGGRIKGISGNLLLEFPVTIMWKWKNNPLQQDESNCNMRKTSDRFCL